GGIALPDLVDGHDVGMVQGGGGARFSLEALQPSRVRRQPGRQDLDRDLALKPRVPGPVNLSHPASPEQAQQLVRAKPRRRGSGHRSAKDPIAGLRSAPQERRSLQKSRAIQKTRKAWGRIFRLLRLDLRSFYA